MPLIDPCCGGVLDKADAEVERDIMRHQPLCNVVGYGAGTPHLKWRSQAYLAVNFVVDSEDGAQNTARHCGSTFTPKPFCRTSLLERR